MLGLFVIRKLSVIKRFGVNWGRRFIGEFEEKLMARKVKEKERDDLSANIIHSTYEKDERD